jgi:hypothetical protein
MIMRNAMNSRKGKNLWSKSTWWWMCEKFGALKWIITIYRSRKRKERHKVMVWNHGKVKP